MINTQNFHQVRRIEIDKSHEKCASDITYHLLCLNIVGIDGSEVRLQCFSPDSIEIRRPHGGRLA